MFQNIRAHVEKRALLCNCLMLKRKETYIRSALNQRRNDCNLYEMFLGEA